MKKILAGLLLFILCGCTTLDLAFISQEKAENKYDEQSEETQLAKQILRNYETGEKTTQFTSGEKLSLDKVVKILSFLIPYDIQLKQRSFPFFDGIKNTIILEILDDNIEESDAMMDQVIATYITNDMNKQEQIDFVHQYIIDHCEYDNSVDKRTQRNKECFQIEGVMMQQNAVCSGYARTFMKFMRKLSIPCIYVSSDEINHSFNLLYDEGFRFVDTTWDEVGNAYYNLSVEDFFKDGNHRLERKYNRKFFMDLLDYVYLLN